MVDSYTKYADAYLGEGQTLFISVHPSDLDEVRVRLALMASREKYSDNFRVAPINNTKEYMVRKHRGCCGSYDTQVKCLSGRIYLIGFNYGH